MTQKYCKLLKKYKNNLIIKHYTKRNVSNNLYNNLNKLKLYNPDLIFICSSTSNHYKHLSLVNNIFKDKLIVVEKPLFQKFKKLKKKNRIYVAYNLRYDPLIQDLKKKIKNQKFWSVEVYCNSYLPNWRDRNYSKTYSAKKKFGGGVLLDLSHELDYLTWIFGDLKIKFVVNNKISNLKINTDDNLLLVATSKNVKQFIIHLNYFSKINSRYITLNGPSINLKADLINKKLIYQKNNKIFNKSWNEKKFDKTFVRQIDSCIKDKKIRLPKIEHGYKILKLIENIRKFK